MLGGTTHNQYIPRAAGVTMEQTAVAKNRAGRGIRMEKISQALSVPSHSMKKIPATFA